MSITLAQALSSIVEAGPCALESTAGALREYSSKVKEMIGTIASEVPSQAGEALSRFAFEKAEAHFCNLELRLLQHLSYAVTRVAQTLVTA